MSDAVRGNRRAKSGSTLPSVSTHQADLFEDQRESAPQPASPPRTEASDTARAHATDSRPLFSPCKPIQASAVSAAPPREQAPEPTSVPATAPTDGSLYHVSRLTAEEIISWAGKWDRAVRQWVILAELLQIHALEAALLEKARGERTVATRRIAGSAQQTDATADALCRIAVHSSVRTEQWVGLRKDHKRRHGNPAAGGGIAVLLAATHELPSSVCLLSTRALYGTSDASWDGGFV